MEHGARLRGAAGMLTGAALVAGTLIAGPAGAAAAMTPAGSVASTSAGVDDDRQYLGKTYYTGEFHAHTSVSDGVEMPEDAFAYVDEHDAADFFAVTEHDVMYDQRNTDEFTTDWRDAESAEWRELHESAEAYNAAHDETVAVPALENTWYDGTGHINVFNTDWKVTARAQTDGSIDGFANNFGTGDVKYDLPTFFARLEQDDDAIGQFNHPSLVSKGNFFGFTGLTPEADARMELIEVKSAPALVEYQRALDAGWHLAPVYNGDEHAANWVTAANPTTGVWADERTLDALYDAMRDRSMYSTFDKNLVLGFSADGNLMGSLLPADDTELDLDVVLDDPDGETFASVELIGNGGEVLHRFTEVGAPALELEHTLPVVDGDFVYVKAVQADGDFAVSAPIWVGSQTAGANYAPEIRFTSTAPKHVEYGERVSLPTITAKDDSGVAAEVAYEVYDAAGEVPVEDGGFTVRSYDDHVVVVKATDATGSTNAELLRLVVQKSDLDPDGVFQYFGTTTTVAEQAGGAGISVSTDRGIPSVYAQVRKVGASSWKKVDVLTSVDDTVYEVNTIARDRVAYQDQITGQGLRSHEFDVRGLETGERYEYRLGVPIGVKKDGTGGKAPAWGASERWTDVVGEFVAGGGEDEPVYVVGDLQATTHDPADLGLLREVTDQLQQQTAGGGTLVQLGDLVDNGGRGQYWEEVSAEVFDGLDLQFAPVAGNHETYGDLEYDSTDTDRTAIFSSMFNTPDNGVIGESNYSFDRGEVHYSVLNSNYDLDEQLAWLVDDVRGSTATWNVVMGHFSYYGGSHGDDAGMAAARAKVTAKLDQLGVDLYLGAHDHVYKRSTIYDGRLASGAEEEALGTTFITMGSAGPKFYDNTVHWWDDVVFDEDTQVGGVLEVVDGGLQFSAYTVDGRTVDRITMTKPIGTWRVSSTAIVDRALPGVGLLSYEGSRDEVLVTAIASTRDGAETDRRSERVDLDHRGVEQFVAFDTPLEAAPSDTVTVRVTDPVTGEQLLEPIVVREGLSGAGTEADPYLIESGADLAKIDYDPAGVYALAGDLDLSGQTISPVGVATTFTGVFDGAGHTVSGYLAPAELGVGLFAENHGTIRNLHVRGDVTSTRSTAGLIADVNHGVIEGSRVSGRLTASDRVGGITGDSWGVVRDSYSTAEVTTTGLYAGGVVGLGRTGSLTERVFATGTVQANGRNAGGLVSYGYEETGVADSVALNAAVSAPSWAHAVVGRVANGQKATLSNNFVGDGVPVATQSLSTAPAADNEKGAVVAEAELRTAAFFEGLGWNFAEVWQWSDGFDRPVLRGNVEEYVVLAPDLPQDARGYYEVSEAGDLAELTRYPEERYVLTADLDLTGEAFTGIRPATAFGGELDGAGHRISGYESTTGGFFDVLGASASVHDLALVDAIVGDTVQKVGILADVNRGVVERVQTSGRVSGPATVGGIVGESLGQLRDVHSTADVTTTAGRQAGGVVGIAGAGSVTERAYATGKVEVVGNSNAGGIVGYAYTGTVVRDSFALNPSVTATGYAHRIAARTLTGHTPTLERNFAAEWVDASTQSVTETGPTTFNGETKSAGEVASQATWQESLGWDFERVWAWDAHAGLPVLQVLVR